MSIDPDFFFKYILPIISGFGVFSFGWNIYNYHQSQSGFLKLQLECSYQAKEDEKYTIARTLLENTSRTPIIVVHAFLLIVDQLVSYEEGIDLVFKHIGQRSSKEKPGYKIIQEYLDTHDNILQRDNLIIRSLPYYFVTHTRLGSFAHMATTHIQSLSQDKIYSIYFAVVGENWYKKNDPSQARVVHDEVIVNTS
jgi:hypothetical protein